MTSIFNRGLAYGYGTDRAGDWRDRAECNGEDPNLFTPEIGPNVPGAVREAHTRAVRKALAVCGRCPVQQACLKDAYATGDKWTIRGGMTGEERVQARRRQAMDELNQSRRSFAAANTVRAANRGGMCTARLHEMTAENTYTSADGYVCCKPCRVENQREYRRRVAERGRQARELAAAGGAA